ncbi:MAG: BPSL0067 family protein [Oscillospiraceae bacterium]|nr:BPSL0067 family protein [Oscillospiraceae bacterium]
MAGPYVYQNPTSLVGKPYVADVRGNNLGECVSLVKHYISELQEEQSSTWIEGPNVIETLKNGGTIVEGTAIATFVDRRFKGHAAFFAGFEKDPSGNIRIKIVDQYLGSQPSGRIILRPLKNKGKKANGRYNDPSNNGEAFSVIL